MTKKRRRKSHAWAPLRPREDEPSSVEGDVYRPGQDGPSSVDYVSRPIYLWSSSCDSDEN
jgi:hypothetical protein